MPSRGSLLVDRALEQDILAETSAWARLQKKTEEREYDPILGDTWEEAQKSLQILRGNIEFYGEYVHGYRAFRHHKFWISLLYQLWSGELGTNRLLILAPPNTAKSTWISQIMPPWYLGNHPDHSIMFFTSSDPMATQFSTSVRLTMQQNDKHRAIFDSPQCRPDFKRGWSSSGLYLKGQPDIIKDPNYRANGFNASVMGGRANGIILDDPLNQKDSMSETEQKNAKSLMDMTIDERLQPDGWMICITTRWHQNDLPGYFIEQAKLGKWYVVKCPQIALERRRPEDPLDPLGREPGEVIWPERRSKEQVLKTRIQMGPAVFNCVHQCDPTGLGGDIFKDQSYFKATPPNFAEEILPHCRISMGWDLAFSEKDRACFTACVVVAHDLRNGNLYIIGVFRDRLSEAGTEDALVKQIMIHKPHIVGIEEAAFKAEVTHRIVYSVMTKVLVQIYSVKPVGDKVTRARLPALWGSQGKCFADHDAPWYPDFISEALGFPNSTYKDQVDAFSLATYMLSVLSMQQGRSEVEVGDGEDSD